MKESQVKGERKEGKGQFSIVIYPASSWFIVQDRAANKEWR
jgi:hypothetical protein